MSFGNNYFSLTSSPTTSERFVTNQLVRLLEQIKEQNDLIIKYLGDEASVLDLINYIFSIQRYSPTSVSSKTTESQIVDLIYPMIMKSISPPVVVTNPVTLVVLKKFKPQITYLVSDNIIESNLFTRVPFTEAFLEDGFRSNEDTMRVAYLAKAIDVPLRFQTFKAIYPNVLPVVVSIIGSNITAGDYNGLLDSQLTYTYIDANFTLGAVKNVYENSFIHTELYVDNYINIDLQYTGTQVDSPIPIFNYIVDKITSSTIGVKWSEISGGVSGEDQEISVGITPDLLDRDLTRLRIQREALYGKNTTTITYESSHVAYAKWEFGGPVIYYDDPVSNNLFMQEFIDNREEYEFQKLDNYISDYVALPGNLTDQKVQFGRSSSLFKRDVDYDDSFFAGGGGMLGPNIWTSRINIPGTLTNGDIIFVGKLAVAAWAGGALIDRSGDVIDIGLSS